MHCKNCGEAVLDESAFCSKCGASIQNVLPKHPAAPTDQPFDIRPPHAGGKTKLKRSAALPVILLLCAPALLIATPIIPLLGAILGLVFIFLFSIFCSTHRGRAASIIGICLSAVVVLVGFIGLVIEGGTNNSAVHAAAPTKLGSSATVQTAQPTPKPTPTPITDVFIISDLSVQEDALGYPVVEFSLINKSDRTLEAIRFAVRCENKFGESIKGFDLLGDGTAYYIYQEPVEPHEQAAIGRLSLSGYSSATVFFVAVKTYQYKDGSKIDIPKQDLLWIKFE